MDHNRWDDYPLARAANEDHTAWINADWLAVYLRDVKPRLTARDVFGELSDFHTVGRNLQGPCPLHGGRIATLVVDPETLRWRCRECGQGGDALDFLGRVSGDPRGRDYVDFVRSVCERFGATLGPQQATPATGLHKRRP